MGTLPFNTTLPVGAGCWKHDTEPIVLNGQTIAGKSFWVAMPDLYCETNGGNGQDTSWLRCVESDFPWNP